MLLNTFNYKRGIFDDFPALKQLEKNDLCYALCAFPEKKKATVKN